MYITETVQRLYYTLLRLRGDVQLSCKFENKNISISRTGLLPPKTGIHSFQKIKQAINTRFYSRSACQVHTQEQNNALLITWNNCKAAQRQTYFENLKIWKTKRGIDWCPLCNHLLRKRLNLAHYPSNFGSKIGYPIANFTISIGSIFRTRTFQSKLITPVSIKAHWRYIFIEKINVNSK